MRFTAMPSARVSERSRWTGRPASSDATAPGEAAASTPITRAPGQRSFTTVATPEIIPPPPMGTTSLVTSGTCSSISSAMVPCPAITAGSSKAWTPVRPSSSTSFSTRAMPSVRVAPVWMTRAP